MGRSRKRIYEAMAQGTQSPKHNSGKKPSGRKAIQNSKDVDGSRAVQLTALPKEMTLNIMQYLSQSYLCHCAQLCSGLAAVAGDNKLWKGFWEDILLREPTLKTIYEESQQGCDYKDLCKRAAVAKGKWKTGQEVTTFTNDNIRNRSPVHQVVICRQYVLVTSVGFAPVYVFSSETGEYSHGLNGLLYHAERVVLSADEQMAAAHSSVSSPVVCVWKVGTGKRLHSFEHTGVVTRIAMQHELLSSIGQMSDVHVWSLESGRLMHKLWLPHGPRNHCQLVMDHHLLAVYQNEPNVLLVWDAKLGNHLLTHMCGPMKFYDEILVDSATHSLVAMRWNAVCVWDTETGTQRGIVSAGQQHQYKRMLVQDSKLIIHSSFHHYAIIVVGLEGTPAVLYSIDDGPATIQDYVPVGMTAAAYRSTKPVSEYIMKAVSSQLVVFTSELDHCAYLFDVKGRKFVKSMAEMGEGQGVIVGLNASFTKLQVIRKAPDTGIMSYVSYDYDAQ